MGFLFVFRMVYTPFNETPAKGNIMFILVPKKNDPLTVVVKGDQWGAFGTPGSIYHQKLYTLLVKKGGIAESVTDGTYHFNIKYGRFFAIYITLIKIED